MKEVGDFFHVKAHRRVSLAHTLELRDFPIITKHLHQAAEEELAGQAGGGLGFLVHGPASAETCWEKRALFFFSFSCFLSFFGCSRS